MMPTYNPFQSYSSNQGGQGQSQGSSFNLPSWAANSSRARQANWGGRGFGGNNVQNMGGQNQQPNWWNNMSRSTGWNWNQGASNTLNPGQGFAPGWAQTGPNEWTRNSMGTQYYTNSPPYGGPQFSMANLVGQEMNQQQGNYDQNRANALNLAGNYQQNNQQMAGQFQQMGQQQFNQGQQQANMFNQMAQQEGPQPQQFGQQAVNDMNNAAGRFREFADSQQDRTAEFASSAMVGSQRQEQNNLQQMRDRFGSMGMGPEAMAMQAQELTAMGSMGRQQLLTQIAQEDRNYQTQMQQAASQLEASAASFSGSMDQANASNRAAYDSMNQQREQAYRQMSVAAGQQAFNNWMATQAQASELQSQGYGVMANAMTQWPNSTISFLGSLVSAANIMDNTSIGRPDFTNRLFAQGGYPS